MQYWPASEILVPSAAEGYRRMVVQHERIRAGLLGCPPGMLLGEHAHLESDEVFHVVSGSATFTIEDVPLEVGPGDLLFVGAGERHEIRVHEDAPLVLLAAVAPNRDDAWVASADAPLHGTAEQSNA